MKRKKEFGGITLIVIISIVVYIFFEIKDIVIVMEQCTNDLFNNYTINFVLKNITIIAIYITFCYFIKKRIEDQVFIDELTGIGNRRKFFRDCHKCYKRKEKIKICFIDLNDFKSINDTYGHLNGDRLLKEFGLTLKNVQELYDVKAYRYAGDEFILLSQNNLTANELEEIVEFLEEKKYLIDKKKTINVTFAYGIIESSECKNIEELIKISDDRMYHDKRRIKRRKEMNIENKSEI